VSWLQFDSHNEKSSVREAVRFAAMLRLPGKITSDKAEVERRVTRTLEQLGLIRMQHDLIGNVDTGGISQEARKKVTIAVELIGEPRIIFLGLGQAHARTQTATAAAAAGPGNLSRLQSLAECEHHLRGVARESWMRESKSSTTCSVLRLRGTRAVLAV
jgi:hypothetical protein